MTIEQFIQKYPPRTIEHYDIGFGPVVALYYEKGHLNVRETGWQALRGHPLTGQYFNIFRWPLAIVDWPWNWFRSPWTRCAKYLELESCSS